MTVETLVDRQAASRSLVRERLLAAISRSWMTLGSWDDADVAAFVDRVVPLVQAGQLQTATLTETYIASVIALLTGETPEPAIDADLVTNLRPVPPEEVYRRPFVEVWTGLKNGQAFTDALQVGNDRLQRLVEDDLDLAHRHASREVFRRTSGVTGYRRVLRPELSRTGFCGLCVAAADQRYRREDLLPIHTRCKCDVLPIIGESDPGRDLNDQDVTALYRRASSEAGGSTNRQDLSKVRFQVNEHGELGPVLRPHRSTFTGPDDIAA